MYRPDVQISWHKHVLLIAAPLPRKSLLVLLVRVSISLFGLQALRRKPDYPKMLERRARLIDRQVDQENTKKESSPASGEEAEREPEETSQMHQHEQPQPQEEQDGARRWTKQDEDEWYAGHERREREAEAARQARAQEAAAEESREIWRERLVREDQRQQERIDRFGEGPFGLKTGDEEARRAYREERCEQLNVILAYAKRKREREATGDQWWDSEQQRVQQQLQDELEREQKQQEEGHRRAQLKKQEEAMMRFKLAAERQREEAAQEAKRIR